MHPSLQRISIWPLYLSLQFVVRGAASPVSSCITGFSRVANEAFVTCVFSQNINVTKHNFNIVHYPELASGEISSSEAHILVCNWAPIILDCMIEDGYRFKHNVTNHVTVTIPMVTEKEKGRYKCQLVPGSKVSPSPCLLSWEDESTSSTVTNPMTSNSGDDDHTDNTNAGYIAAIVFLTILVIALGAFATFMVYKRGIPCGKSEPEENKSKLALLDLTGEPQQKQTPECVIQYCTSSTQTPNPVDM